MKERRPSLRLLTLTRRELDELYAASPAGAIPSGAGRGLALILPGTPFVAPLARAVRVVAWQGKRFDAAAGRLVNSITPFGVEAVPAEVYIGQARFDGKDAIVLDYSRTSSIARPIRDEIRNVGPGTYLGFAYCGSLRWMTFALDFNDSAARS